MTLIELETELAQLQNQRKSFSYLWDTLWSDECSNDTPLQQAIAVIIQRTDMKIVEMINEINDPSPSLF